jgi:hypothetical protein
MRSYNLQKDGTGNGAGSDYINRILKRLEELQFYDSQTIGVEQTTRGTRFNLKAIKSGDSSGFSWQQPNLELDPTLAVPKWTFVYISPLNPIVTTGMLDLVTGELTSAQPGTWQAKVNIPAQAVNPAGKPAGTYFNVPAVVTRADQAVPTGTPLEGDLDSAMLLWIKWPETNSCL